MNTNENTFLNNLGDTPSIPDSILPKVRKVVRQRRIVSATLWSMVVAFVLGTSAIALVPAHKETPVATTIDSSGAYMEIQEVAEFLDLTGLDGDIEMFAFVDPDVF